MIYFFQIHQLEIKINFYGNKNIILIHIFHLRTIDQERIKEHEKRKEREEKKRKMKRNARLRFRWNLIRCNKLNSIHPSSSFSSFPCGKNMLIESKLRSHLGFLHLVTRSLMRSHVLRASMHTGCISAKEGVKVTPARVHFAPICVSYCPRECQWTR